jgi:formylglycine-generating enzyme required for sulfatase activity
LILHSILYKLEKMTRMYIKSSLFFAVVLFFATSSLSVFCSAQKSNPNPNPTQLKSRTRPVIPFRHVTLAAPPGMVYIPGGSVTIKYSQSSSDTNSKKRVSLTSFYIDKTEVTNQQYRLFTEWVIDSIAVKCYLKDEKYFYPLPENNNAVADASEKSIDNVVADTSKHDSLNFIQKDNIAAAQPVKDTTSFTNRRINWSKVNHKEIFESNDEGIRSKIQPMLNAEGKIRPELYTYTY